MRSRRAAADVEADPTYEFVPGGDLGDRTDSPVSGPVAAAVGYRSTLAGQPVHRGLPSPYLTLVISLAGPVVTGEDHAHALSPAAYRHTVLVGGLHARPAYVAPDDRQAGLQLALHPLAARQVLGLGPDELTRLVSDGSDLLGRSVERLRNRLLEAPHWPGRFALARDWLRAQAVAAGPAATPRPELVEAWRWLSVGAGRGSMDDLAGHVALSPRQLRTVFARDLGVGPKQLARLMRFGAARHRIATAVAAGSPLDLTSVAATTGYYDHAHLDREFAAFAAVSPSGWVAEERRNIQAGGHRQPAG